jgi:glucose/arabinose dehydrogenase
MRKLTAIVVLLMIAGCGGKPPAPPAPSPGGGGNETINGTERLGWDQQADSTAELATFRYAIFVDGLRSEMAAVSCGPSPSASGFACSGRLPAMSAGAHALQLATFVVQNGETLESERSATLNVVVAASPASAQTMTRGAGAIIGTSGGATFRVAQLVNGLEQPTDMAVASDGRVFVTEEPGRISIVAAGRRRTALEGVPGARLAIVGLALDPQFGRNGLVYVVRAVLDGAPPVFQLVRYREVGGTLGEAATLLDRIPASVAQPAAAIRFGPDGRLYVAFEQAIDAASSEGAFNGRVLRLNPDGTTPRDQRGGSPVFASGARRPRGLDWDPMGALWIVDGDVPRTERLIGVQPGLAPRAPAVSLALPEPFGAASAVFHPTGDLLIGAEIGRYILRIHFDPANRQRVLSTERLLEGEVDAVRAIAATPDGTVYVCTNATLMTLKPRTR